MATDSELALNSERIEMTGRQSDISIRPSVADLTEYHSDLYHVLCRCRSSSGAPIQGVGDRANNPAIWATTLKLNISYTTILQRFPRNEFRILDRLRLAYPYTLVLRPPKLRKVEGS